jgi:hypothetical protein
MKNNNKNVFDSELSPRKSKKMENFKTKDLLVSISNRHPNHLDMLKTDNCAHSCACTDVTHKPPKPHQSELGKGARATELDKLKKAISGRKQQEFA